MPGNEGFGNINIKSVILSKKGSTGPVVPSFLLARFVCFHNLPKRRDLSWVRKVVLKISGNEFLHLN